MVLMMVGLFLLLTLQPLTEHISNLSLLTFYTNGQYANDWPYGLNVLDCGSAEWPRLRVV
jgi:hypothetical protein